MIILTLFLAFSVQAKEIALTFDDAPVDTTKHYSSLARTRLLISKLKALNVPPVMVFSNPCKRENTERVLQQLDLYRKAGHAVGNHTCSHHRLDDVGFEVYSKDAARADRLLQPLFGKHKYFRYPYLNESNDKDLRDRMRRWLRQNNYRHGAVSVDNDDYQVSFKINQALERGHNIDYKKVEKIFLDHLIGAVDYYDGLAVKTLGRSPKHVMLLHEMDATVMFIDSLVKELRRKGWTIISAEEAFEDPVYRQTPANLYANNGIVAQIALERTGQRHWYDHWKTLNQQLDKLLGETHHDK